MRPLAAPAIHITRSDTPSHSHLGGIADLPAGLTWPEYKGNSLSLLAHLSLPDLHAAHPIEWLPTNGSLLFFYDVDRQPWGYDPHDRGSARVLHIPDPAAPPSHAGNQAKKGTPILPRQDVAFRKIQVFPADRSCVRALDLSDEESDAFCSAADAAFGNKPHHQVAGYPGPVQTDDMELECHLVTNGLYLGDSRQDDSTRTEELRGRAAAGVRSDIRTQARPSCGLHRARLRNLSTSRASVRTVRGMTRPLRLEFPGALYHVTARGNRRKPIYLNDGDRLAWLKVLALVCKRHHCFVHSYCQMSNHYHLLIETVEPNLSQAMRQLNGSYTQYFNWRHSLVGHLFQGRYKAILVQKESYLLELARYIVLNPVRANMVMLPDDWPWSSHRYTVGREVPPDWLEHNSLLGRFGNTFKEAAFAYQAFVLAGVGEASPLAATRHQILLGDDAFVSKYQQLQRSEELTETAKIERRAVTLSLAEYRTRYLDRDEAMARAYLSTAFTMPEIAGAFNVSTKTVSRAVAAFEGRT